MREGAKSRLPIQQERCFSYQQKTLVIRTHTGFYKGKIAVTRTRTSGIFLNNFVLFRRLQSSIRQTVNLRHLIFHPSFFLHHSPG